MAADSRLEDVFASPLADTVVGPRDGAFVMAEWTDPGGPDRTPETLQEHFRKHGCEIVG